MSRRQFFKNLLLGSLAFLFWLFNRQRPINKLRFKAEFTIATKPVHADWGIPVFYKRS